MSKVILLTGASSGIGYLTAKRLAKEGHKVYGAARHLEKMENLKQAGVHPIYLDLTNEKTIKQVSEAILEKEGKLDILINNAGYAVYGAVEDVSLEDARKQFEVNLFGLARLTQEILPYMRAQKSGRIINISSIGGRITTIMGSWYHASKYALEALSDGLRMETRPFGLEVVLIEPGNIKTPWSQIATENLQVSAAGGAYEETAGKVSRSIERMYTGQFVSEPDIVAKKIIKIVNAKRVKPRYLVGRGGKVIVFLHTILPAKVFDWLVVKSLT
ncbi:oxidoreductase [Streptococcus caviae]|uniref:oxidoreductase n=1 Tax=Streptococcus sp. 'caviae' TaxID=1915004 RepID=UPI00094B7C09|nr:oxidoreductase [Streptococcus sp. 'caviae']OLN84118.1 short-chain dehydrogenase/reductase [Streptococcus sp. 'caviae']